jgi:hypothetical protein
MRKTFAVIAPIITIALILTSLAYSAKPAANSASDGTETEWQLTVTGLVENPLSLNWTEITAMPKTSVNAELICVDFPTIPIAKGNWTGIKLKTLLEEAAPSANAIKVGFFAADGYATDLTVEAAMSDDIILAYEKDGASLNDLRLVVPGRWGYKWISQLTRIELFDYNFLGVWESRGYPDEASFTGPTSRSSSVSTPPIPPTPSSTPPSPSPSPSPFSSPTASPAPPQVTPPPETSEHSSIPKEAVYVIAASGLAAALIAVLTFVRKRTKRTK